MLHTVPPVRADFYVYIIHDSTGDPVYVGKGRGKRARLNANRNAKIEALISFGGTLAPVKVREGMTEDEAHEAERALIAYHGRMDLGLGPLLNLCDGGAHTNGRRIVSDETRAKHSENLKSRHIAGSAPAGNLGKPMHPNTRAAHLGAKRSAETREKMRIAALRRASRPPPSPETRAKLSEAHRGRKASPETRAKIAEALRERSRLAKLAAEPISEGIHP
ncbi:MAG TPA: NUMOD3 domain-containing DNA-binding protein [Roseiarcus sp.]|jgi:hypothetical protein|nr:NUMOD3 domain-containing DNA-binding protein [Roseiarcus sp.]